MNEVDWCCGVQVPVQLVQNDPLHAKNLRCWKVASAPQHQVSDRTDDLLQHNTRKQINVPFSRYSRVSVFCVCVCVCVCVCFLCISKEILPRLPRWSWQPEPVRWKRCTSGILVEPETRKILQLVLKVQKIQKHVRKQKLLTALTDSDRFWQWMWEMNRLQVTYESSICERFRFMQLLL